MHTHERVRAASAKTIAEPVQPGAEWLRMNDVRPTFGFSRTTTYELIAEGKFRSVSLRRPGRSKGMRLVSVASIRAYIEAQVQAEEAAAK